MFVYNIYIIIYVFIEDYITLTIIILKFYKVSRGTDESCKFSHITYITIILADSSICWYHIFQYLTSWECNIQNKLILWI
jgi:hypothetical protein